MWETAKQFGMCGQSVHERLVKLNLTNPVNVFTKEDDTVLQREYANYADAGKLDDLARQMGRTKPFIARQARRLGLTEPNRKKPYLADTLSERAKKWHSENDHPRGMLGKKHSERFKDAQSQRSLDRWDSMTKDQKLQFGSHSVRAWKTGWREVGGKRVYFRSSWEANYARYLEWLLNRKQIAAWEHESETFWFHAIKRGCRSYLPDFKVTELNGSIAFHEVKGWMDARSKTKIKRMAKYYPSVRLIVIERKAYKSIEKTMSRMLPGWE